MRERKKKKHDGCLNDGWEEVGEFSLKQENSVLRKKTTMLPKN
jgi:hypothetical protein